MFSLDVLSNQHLKRAIVRPFYGCCVKWPTGDHFRCVGTEVSIPLLDKKQVFRVVIILDVSEMDSDSKVGTNAVHLLNEDICSVFFFFLNEGCNLTENLCSCLQRKQYHFYHSGHSKSTKSWWSREKRWLNFNPSICKSDAPLLSHVALLYTFFMIAQETGTGFTALCSMYLFYSSLPQEVFLQSQRLCSRAFGTNRMLLAGKHCSKWKMRVNS